MSIKTVIILQKQNIQGILQLIFHWGLKNVAATVNFYWSHIMIFSLNGKCKSIDQQDFCYSQRVIVLAFHQEHAALWHLMYHA